MAENRESTILDVQLDAGRVAEDLQQLITRIAEMKRQQKELNDEIKAGNDVDGKYAEQLIRVKDQLAWTEKQAKGLSATTKLLNADTLTYSDSLNGERQKLADMQKAYDQLDASQRESEGGQKFLEAIQKQSEAVKELEANTGRAQRNVGNYPKAWENATPGLSKASKVLNALGVDMGDLQTKGAKAFAGLGQSVKAFGKAFITPPIIIITAVVSAILLIFNKLKEAFQKSDDAMTALQKAFAVFKPIGEAVRAVFDGLALALGKVAEAAANAVSWIADKLSPAYAKAAKDAQDLVVAQDKLEDKEREYTENSARRNMGIAKLRAEAADKEKYSVEERRKRLQLAIKLERKNLEDEKKIKAEQLRIIEETAKRERDTSDETKNKIAAARAAMYQAEQNYYTGVRSLQKQLTSFDKEEKAAEKEAQREAQQRAKEQAAEAKRQAEERKREAKQRAAEAKRQADEAKKAEQAYQDWVIATRRETEDALLSLEKDGAEKQIKQAQIAGEREVETLRVKLSRLRAADEEARQKLQDLIAATEAATAKRVQEIQIKADADAAALKRSNDRKRLEQGRKTALELAQIQADATADEYARLQRLTDEEVTVLYGTWENYEGALLDAEKNAFEAREALAGTEYALRQKRMENEYAERLQRIDDEYALAEVEYEQAQEKYETLLAMDEEQKARLFENEEAYKAATIEAENEIVEASENAIKTRIKSIGTLGNAFNDLANSLGEFADESKGAAVAQKAFAFTGIILNQAQAISEGALAIAKGVESAAGIPFPANIPAIISVTAQIAAMIAGVTSSISQAKSIFSQADADAGNYAGGGVVPGTSYTGDRLVAHVNSGEGIYTSGQANNLLQEIANNPARGGIDYGAMAEAMVAAVSAMPAPVMDYQEFKTFEQDVATYNEIAKI